MKINTLNIKNFHNAKDVTVEFGNTTNIYGANGAGKTSILDAIYFLLYQTDSKGKSDTTVRPYDQAGELLHDIDTTVTGNFVSEDGEPFTLQVIFKEKWTKVNGHSERKLTGNTTEYFIDGVPKKAKEYAAFVQDHFFEPWFSLTSNPATFPGMHWQAQRNLLLDLVGDVTAEDVIKANPDLAILMEGLSQFGADDYKAKLLHEKKMRNKAIIELPARIDERRKTLLSFNDLEAEEKVRLEKIKGLEKEMEEAMAEKSAIIAGSGKQKLEAEIDTIRQKQEVIRGFYREKLAETKKPYFDAMANIDNDVKLKSDQLRRLRSQMMDLDMDISDIGDQLRACGHEWKEVHDSIFEDTECPCCHRPYTPEMLEPMEAEFNQRKAETLTQINKKGSSLGEKSAEMKEKRSALLLQINELATFELDKAPKLKQENMEAMNAAVAKMPALEEFIHPETKEKFWDLSEALKLRERELENARLGASNQTTGIDAKILSLKTDISALNQEVARIRTDVNSRNAIAELEQQKQEAMEAMDKVEQLLALLGNFHMAKVAMLDAKINSTFKRVSFRLFEKNIGNDGIKETCELMMHGVPYRQLSNAEKCMAGMEVVRAISTLRNIQNPVFIDNREGITEIGEAPGQVVNLIVSPADEKLRIEVEN